MKVGGSESTTTPIDPNLMGAGLTVGDGSGRGSMVDSPPDEGMGPPNGLEGHIPEATSSH
jgi:hypothetical protein